MPASLQIRGFTRLRNRLDPVKVNRRMIKAVKKATIKNGLIAEGAIKLGIDSGLGMAPNSSMTTAIKGSSRPLVDAGDLKSSVDNKVTRYDQVVIGVLKNATKRDPDTGRVTKIKEVAAILHQGATVTVTDKMRRFFFAMAKKHPGKWHPLSAGTKVLVIPARPFLKFAIEKKQKVKYEKNWNEAVRQVLAGVG